MATSVNLIARVVTLRAGASVARMICIGDRTAHATKLPRCGLGGRRGITTVSASVAELLPEVGSVTPAGLATVAVLLMLPIAVADTAKWR